MEDELRLVMKDVRVAIEKEQFAPLRRATRRLRDVDMRIVKIACLIDQSQSVPRSSG